MKRRFGAARLANALEFIQKLLMVLKPNWESGESAYLEASVSALRSLVPTAQSRYSHLG